jgi:diaminopimelate epimerase
MILKFTKYQGTGNDFIMIDSRDLNGVELSLESIRQLCNRRFGIGADGLIIIKEDTHSDFYVDYYNADGTQSFCGNGARCSVKFAKDIGRIDSKCDFNAIDGLHHAQINSNGDVKLLMSKVETISNPTNECFVLDTGSPHFVRFVQSLDEINIVNYGREIRYSANYTTKGINVNVAQIDTDKILVKTYERGVEDETFSCGTGVTAVALAAAIDENADEGVTNIQTKGGLLKVYWKKKADGFDSIFLEGPAEKVYDGQLEI